jgi:3-dehydroquinate dehydratase-2
MKILILNGPNLNMLGKREPSVYGDLNFNGLLSKIKMLADELDIETVFFQSNLEGELVNKIQESEGFDGIIINAGAYTHTSIAIRDALLSVSIPFIEVHISNVYSREPFRHHSYLSDIAKGVIAGFGVYGYLFALQYFSDNR